MTLTDFSRVIGTVASVESERILIQLDQAAPALVKAGSSGILPVGAINSYLTIDVGPHSVVAVITAIKISEDRTRTEDPIDEGVSSRFIEATLIGRLESGCFTSGLISFPSLFAPVAAASPSEIDCIFRPSDAFRLRLGEAVIAPEQDVFLDPDALMARHYAILGSTGSGKSCTVSAILEALAELNTPNATAIIFDANGEYHAVGTGGKAPWNTLRIGLGDSADARLIAPHWLMTMREHSDLLLAGPGVQEPLLHRAVLEAKLRHDDADAIVHRLDMITKVLSTARTISQSNGQVQPQLIKQFAALEKALAKFEAEEGADSSYGSIQAKIQQWHKLNLVKEVDGRANWDRLDIIQEARLDQILRESEEIATATYKRLGVSEASEGNADAPHYYDLRNLLLRDLPRVIEAEALQDQKIRSFASSLLLRIARLLSDDRYSFITKIPPLPGGLSSLLRLLLGRWPSLGESEPWYARPGAEAPKRFQAIVLDLSDVGSDVLAPVTSLIARVLFEFAQRVRPRASLPILLVLEEAHRYVPARATDDVAFGRINVFERIAKEGRKFGLSLCVSSQRPSELSKTVVSQCGTLIAHRIVNPDDQELIRYASPVASRDVLRQLPSLAKQHAIVLGEAVPAPTYVRIRDVLVLPSSQDPQFINAWTKEPADAEDILEIDRVAAEWSAVQAPRSDAEEKPGA